MRIGTFLSLFRTKTFAWLFALASFVGAAPALAQTVYFHNDAAGSPVAASDENGALLWRQSYRPYGNRIQSITNTAPNTVWAFGKEFDEDTKLSYFGARWYDPVLGRFMARDPAEFSPKNVQSFNRYAYANNNPYRFGDPDGRDLVDFGVLFSIFSNPFSASNAQANRDGGQGLRAAEAVGQDVQSGATQAGYFALCLECRALEATAPLLGSFARFAATEARGLSRFGGSFSSTFNSAGGEVWTSVGRISQNDFATYVNSGLYRGNVSIISGVHGEASGATTAAYDLYEADLARFGNIPGVTVFNFPEMSPGQISGLLRGPGTTIGGFCNSGACLAPFK